MFAVIKTGGKQYRVQEGDILEIEKLDYQAGQEIEFTDVLLVDDDSQTLIGTPFVEQAKVVGIVVESFKGEKVIVFKKKRRKQYRRKKGHRQQLLKVKIAKIIVGPAPKKKPIESKEEPVTKEPQKAKPRPAPGKKTKEKVVTPPQDEEALPVALPRKGPREKNQQPPKKLKNKEKLLKIKQRKQRRWPPRRRSRNHRRKNL